MLAPGLWRSGLPVSLRTWIAFWRRPGETYFDFSTRTLWAKFTHLAEAATIPVITIYVVAFVITAFIV